MDLTDHASQAIHAHAQIFANRDFSTTCMLIFIILFIQLAACKQGGAGRGQGGEEPGARVTFGVDLVGFPYGQRHAEIIIDGKLICSVPNGGKESVFLPKGDYRILVSAEGFESIEKEVSVQNSPTQSLHFTLRMKQ